MNVIINSRVFKQRKIYNFVKSHTLAEKHTHLTRLLMN